MHTILHYAYENPVLSIALLCFTVWMFVDAYRRGVEQFWFLLIFFIPLVGALAYFFVVFLPQVRFGNFALFEKKVALDELRYRAEHSPTLTNKVALAERLIEKENHLEALPFLESAHKIEPEHCLILYFLALCYSKLDHVDLALPLLEQIKTRDPRWSDYKAWRLLVEVHGQANNPEAALDHSRALVNLSPTLQHKCVLAEHLIASNQQDEARRLLEKALDDHAYTPGPIRRRNKPWAKKAGALLKQVG